MEVQLLVLNAVIPSVACFENKRFELSACITDES
jgi:hypothetical protein